MKDQKEVFLMMGVAGERYLGQLIQYPVYSSELEYLWGG